MSLSLFFLPLWCSVAAAHPPAADELQALTTEDGLPQNWINAVEQTPDGRLWIATNGGLSRFDGVVLSEEPALAGSAVTHLLLDSRDRLWISTPEERWSLDGATLSSIPLEAAQRGAPLFRDRDGEVWAVTPARLIAADDPSRQVAAPPGCALRLWEPPSALSCQDSEQWVALRGGVLQVQQDIDGQPLTATGAFIDRRGILWKRTPTSLQRYLQEANGRYRPLPAAPALDLHATALHESDSGEVWVGTSEGAILVWDGAQFQTHTTLERSIRQIFEDREGNTWAATRGQGLLRLTTPHSFSMLVEGLPDAMVWSIAQGDDGTTWLGTEDGLVQVDPDGTITPADTPRGPVYGISTAPSGAVVFGGEQQLTSLRDGQQERWHLSGESRIRGGVLRDQGGTLWLGTREGLWVKPPDADAPQPRPLPRPLTADYPPIGAIIEDAGGRVWVASNVGVFIWDGAAWETLDVGHIRGLSLASDGSTWATRSGPGLLLIRDGAVHEIGPEQGLPAEPIHAVLEDGLGGAWLTSNRGIFRVSASRLVEAARDPAVRLTPIHYGVADGLLSLEFNSGAPAALRAQDGTLWFPSVRGIARVDPAALQTNTLPPVPIIEGLVVDADEVPLGGPLTLSPDTRALTIRYTAPSLRDPRGLTFRYRLEGDDEDWITTGSRQAVWTRLPPGQYTFRLQATNSDGVASEQEATLTFTIKAHIYQQGWFIALAALGVLALGSGGVQYRLQVLREKELARLIDERTAALQQAHDHSEQQRLQLAEQAAELSRLDAMKTRFFANVSHELRTPLALIRGPVSGALSDDRPLTGDDLRRVERNAGRLEALIDELLDIARLDAGRLPLCAGERDLSALLTERSAAFSEAARRQGVALTVIASPLQVWCDPERIRKVLDNLLSNALRYTPAGGDIRLTLHSTADSAVVTVADSGSGIAPEHLPHIFERFYQAAEPDSRPTGGVGIGLSLARDLVARHGGEISAASEPGGGTTFTVRLPLGQAHLEAADLQPPPAPPAARDAPEPAPAARQEATILIIEDDPDMRAWIRQVLAARFAVLEAPDGRAGLALARQQVPDVIVSDVMMPKMDGMTLCEEVRADPTLSHLPVVLLTARAATDSRLAGLAHGADVYLTKPFHPRELRLQLDNLLAARARLQRQHRQRMMQDDDIAVTSEADRFLLRVREAILANLSQQGFGVSELAEALAMSRRQLSRKLSVLLGEPPSMLIRRLRVHRGRALLKQDAGNISEIAYAIGYRKPSRFSEQFQAEFGMSPSQYRQQQAGSD